MDLGISGSSRSVEAAHGGQLTVRAYPAVHVHDTIVHVHDALMWP